MAEERHQQNETTHVFISHKSKDKDAALKLKDLLTSSINGLQVFASCDAADLRVGEEWNSKIHEELTRAYWMILLYTDPSDNWDWCLYECGYHALKIHKQELDPPADGKCYKMTVLCPEGVTPPAPLTRWQFAGAHAELLETLLTDLQSAFGEGGRSLSVQQRHHIASEISNLVQSLNVTYSFEGGLVSVSAEINSINRLRDRSADKILLAADENGAAMLGLQNRRQKVVKAIPLSEVKDANGELRLDLSSVITALEQAASDSQAIEPAILPVVFSDHRSAYMPIVQRAILRGNNPDFEGKPSVTIQLLLVESPLSYRNNVDDAVHNLLFVARAFRWKVIEDYQNLMITIATNRIISAQDIPRLHALDAQIDLSIRLARGKDLSEALLREIDAARTTKIQQASGRWESSLRSFRTALRNAGDKKEETARDLVSAYEAMRDINQTILQEICDECAARMRRYFVLDRPLKVMFDPVVQIVVPAAADTPAATGATPAAGNAPSVGAPCG